MTVALLGIGLGIRAMLGSAHGGAESLVVPGSAQPPAIAAAGSQAAELAELRREMLQLRKQVHAQGEQLDSAANAPYDDSQAVADRHDPQAVLERREEDERKHREYMVGVDAAFRNEATDPRWAATTTVAVQAAITETGELRQLARSVECRSSTCRVELTDNGSGKLASVLPAFAMRVGHELPSVDIGRIQDASGAATTVLYMSRHSSAVVSR